MKILIAPDSFKGSLSSLQAANIISQAIKDTDPTIETVIFPMADGGEGSLACVLQLPVTTKHTIWVEGPYGEPTLASFAVQQDMAFIEMAQASGLLLTTPKQRNPMQASTVGVGQLIKAALDLSCKQITLCLGGSATNDAGAGMAHALGVRFYHQDQLLKPIPEELRCCDRIDTSQLDVRLKTCQITVACDVINPLCGPQGASHVFARQKGADENMIIQLDHILMHFSQIVESATGIQAAQLPGSGAAGGLGFGLLTFLNGHFACGVETMLKITDFQEIVKHVDLVITGEGSTDQQTALGKTPVGVAQAAKKANKPVILISGGLCPDSEALKDKGIDAMFGCAQSCQSVEEAINQAEQLLYQCTCNIIRTLTLFH